MSNKLNILELDPSKKYLVGVRFDKLDNIPGRQEMIEQLKRMRECFANLGIDTIMYVPDLLDLDINVADFDSMTDIWAQQGAFDGVTKEALKTEVANLKAALYKLANQIKKTDLNICDLVMDCTDCPLRYNTDNCYESSTNTDEIVRWALNNE